MVFLSAVKCAEGDRADGADRSPGSRLDGESSAAARLSQPQGMPSAVKGVLGGTGAVKGVPGVACPAKGGHGISCAAKGVHDDEDAISEIVSASAGPDRGSPPKTTSTLEYSYSISFSDDDVDCLDEEPSRDASGRWDETHQEAEETLLRVLLSRGAGTDVRARHDRRGLWCPVRKQAPRVLIDRCLRSVRGFLTKNLFTLLTMWPISCMIS